MALTFFIDLYMEYTRKKYDYAKILEFDGEGLDQIERHVTIHKEYYKRQCLKLSVANFLKLAMIDLKILCPYSL